MHRAPAAATTTGLIFLLVAVPVYLVAQMLVVQAIDLYSTLRAYLQEPGIGSIVTAVQSWSLLDKFDLSRIDWGSIASRGLSQTASLATDLVNRTSAGVVSAVADSFVVFFSLFFFFKDGDKMLDGLKQAMPMEPRHVERVADEFRRTSKARRFGYRGYRYNSGNNWRRDFSDCRY